MSYSHNSEADFAGSELARIFAASPQLCYAAPTVPAAVSATASYEPSSSPWPRADGLVFILESGDVQRDIAIEYKRRQEGVHGLLTGIGQAFGYLHKGYNGAAIVVPDSYATLENPGAYVTNVLDRVEGSKAIGVFHYETPDVTSPAPFAGRLHCVRPLELVTTTTATSTGVSRPKTQWVHMREGSTTRDAFFRFLQTAKQLSIGHQPQTPSIPIELVEAIARVAPNRDPYSYLANTADDRFLSMVWAAFWFEWIATPAVLTPWLFDGTYSTPNAFTRIQKDDGAGPSQIFEGRADGLKENIVELLNAGQISEDEGWEMLVAGIRRPDSQNKQGIRDRAHSYREDVDSSLSQLQLIDSTGRPTEYGYRYMDICERYGGANSPAAVEYIGASLLQTGRYAAFIHYVHRLSERVFSENPLAFTRMNPAGEPVFTEDSYAEYLSYIEGQLADELKVMRKVTGRARPRRRTPFQAELTLLRRYGFVAPTRHRLGVGIPVNWERVMDALAIDL
jgi:hypothetical protein